MEFFVCFKKNKKWPNFAEKTKRISEFYMEVCNVFWKREEAIRNILNINEHELEV